LTSHQIYSLSLHDALPISMGSAITYLVPDQMFETLDGPIAVSVTSEAQWRGFCSAIERPELADDPRFAHNRARVTNREALIRIRSEEHTSELQSRENLLCP